MNAPRILVALLAVSALTACGAAEIADGDDTDLAGIDSSLTTKGRFETFVGQDGRYYFHLLAGNGEKVLASQGYDSASGAQAGIGSVNVNGTEASAYEMRLASDGANYFVLKAGNGQVVGVSEMYASLANAQRGLNTVVTIVQYTAAQPSVAVTGVRFESFKGIDGKYYFHLRAGNGEIVLQSQAYTTSASATSGVASVKVNGKIATRFEVRAAVDGQYYFVLKAANGKVIGRGEMYASKSNAERGAATCAEVVGSIQ
jgi:uncharacterized protein YegP (UPF0339 family)